MRVFFGESINDLIHNQSCVVCVNLMTPTGLHFTDPFLFKELLPIVLDFLLGNLQHDPFRVIDNLLRRVIFESFCGNLQANHNLKVDLTVESLQHGLSLDDAKFLREFLES